LRNENQKENIGWIKRERIHYPQRQAAINCREDTAHRDHAGKEEKMKREKGRRAHLTATIWTQVLVIPITFLLWGGWVLAGSSANYTIQFDVISGGGGPSDSANYNLHSTLGEPSIGSSNSSHYADHAGFWYAFLPDISVNYGSFNFERVFVDQSSPPKAFTVTNPGTLDLAIETLSLTGANSSEFHIADDNCSNKVISPAETCTFEVVFSPTSQGKKSAKVSIPSNDADDPDGVREVDLSGRGVLLMVNPEEGTIGTQITIGGSGFGGKKGKVLFGLAKPKVVTWAGGSINLLLSKALPTAPYDVVVQPKEPKGAAWTTEPGGFTVKGPEIGEVKPPSGTPLTQITITGGFFGTKKGKVYLEREGVAKGCKVVTWTMGEIKFLVPKNYPPGACTLKVTNKVGSGTAAFTGLE
jgi:hypothetical protein